jgi:hypothetical protein
MRSRLSPRAGEIVAASVLDAAGARSDIGLR